MPRGRSSFTKRLKEQARQQKQRNKADRRSQRHQEKSQTPAADQSSLSSEAKLPSLTIQQPGLPDTQNELSQKHTPRQ
jgi:hypothetical protein